MYDGTFFFFFFLAHSSQHWGYRYPGSKAPGHQHHQNCFLLILPNWFPMKWSSLSWIHWNLKIQIQEKMGKLFNSQNRRLGDNSSTNTLTIVLKITQFCAKLLEWYLCKSHMLFATISTHFPLDKKTAILADDIFKCIFLNEKIRILIQIYLKFVSGGLIDNSQALI